MFRDYLPPDHSMFFVFPENQERCCFWMRNTFIPLDIAFISDDFRIIEIITRSPHSEQLSCVSGVRYVLEANKEWFLRHGVQRGTKISFFKSILLEKKNNLW